MELLKESESGRRRRDGSVGRRGGQHQGDRWGDIYANMTVRKMVALYDYDPQELSPNVDSEVGDLGVWLKTEREGRELVGWSFFLFFFGDCYEVCYKDCSFDFLTVPSSLLCYCSSCLLP